MRLGTLIAVAVVAVLVLMLVAVLASKRKPAGGAGKVRSRVLLTANELEFLNRLEIAAPELRFHAQVAMGALLEPAFAKKLNPSAYMSIRGTFSQKVVDYVAQDRGTGAVLAVVELDDRTHDVAKDRKRDEMLQEAGYKVVRWQSTAKPDSAAIRASLIPSPPGRPTLLQIGRPSVAT